MNCLIIFPNVKFRSDTNFTKFSSNKAQQIKKISTKNFQFGKAFWE